MNINVYAHRGSSGTAPQNTMYAFRKAVADGADGIETDVRKSRDGVLFILHDLNLKNVCADPAAAEIDVLNADFADFCGFDIRGGFTDVPVQRVPRLEELLQLVKETGITVNIELKANPRANDGLEYDVLDMVKAYGVGDRIFYSCFDHSLLAAVKAKDPSARVAPLYSHSPYREWDYAKSFGAFAVHPEWRDGLLRGNFKECRKAGLEVNVWTVNHAQDVPALIEAGATGLITNFPAEIRRAAEEYFNK